MDAQRGADGQHPFTQAEGIAVSEGNGGKVIGIHLDDGHVRCGVRAHHGGVVLLVVVQRHLDFAGTVDHVVVGDDITVRADDDAAATALLLTRLGIAILVSEEETEKRVDGLVLLTALDRHFHIYDSLHGAFRRVGEIGIIGFCQIDSTVFYGTAIFVSNDSYLLVLGRRGRFHGFYDTECGEAAGQYR